jgi:MFS family permease
VKNITRTVWILSLVSMFTDMASEMLYPVTPIYLRSIGFSILLIGILEGVVEAFAGLSKSYFGKLSDNMGKRVPFVQLGYTLSALSKPMMAFFAAPAWVFLVRTLDRIGKGVRTGARDALLSDESTPQTKATVFGFHRSFDTFGAVLGPAFALLFLYFYPASYKKLFYVAFIPGVLAVVSTFLLKEKLQAPVIKKATVSFFSFIDYWKTSSPAYKKLVIGLLIFALFNSSDIFLLLKAKESGISDSQVIGLYIFYNLVYALMAYPVGLLADKIGFKKMLLIGLAIFSAVYFLMGIANNKLVLLIAFFLYGVYASATEGVSKAWITNLANKNNVATAIGTYGGFQSICSLLASTISGFLWYRFGSSTTFFLSAMGSMVALGYLYYFMKRVR